MRPFLADVLLLVWATISIVGTGVAICHRLTRLRGLELLGFGSAAGAALFALLGLLLAAVPAVRVPVAAITLVAPVAIALYWSISRLGHELYTTLSRVVKRALLLWLLFDVLCLYLIRLNVTPPAVLPDGRFIFKQPQLNVKIQYMAGLPADNYIPFVVTEFFLCRISLKREHPILPGQEVSNRTILMSLVALPFRAALSSAQPVSLGTFRYVGQDWPDVSKLNTGHRYEQSLVLGLLLNSFLLLGLFVFVSGLKGGVEILVPASLLFVTSAYFIVQTVFIWPKSMAGFFTILGWHGIRRGFSPIVVALCAGLAYHSHPLSLAFAAGIGLFYFATGWNNRREWRSLVIFVAVFALVLVPWVLWTTFYLRLPSSLLAQNFLAIHGRPLPAINVLWARFKNLFDLLTPTVFDIYPFDLSRITAQATFSLPGAIGLLVSVPALLQLSRFRVEGAFLWCAFILPALALVFVFNFPTITSAQLPATLSVLLSLGLIWMHEHLSRPLFHVAIALQLACNLTVWAMYGAVWSTSQP